MFIAALFIIAKLWKQPRCPITDDWNKKIWCLYTTEFYSSTKKDEILSFLGKWMDLENILFIGFRKPKAACFLSYVEYRSDIKAAIL
jgi:hypothetical protein